MGMGERGQGEEGARGWGELAFWLPLDGDSDVRQTCGSTSPSRSLSNTTTTYFFLVDDNDGVIPVHDDTSALTFHWPGRMKSFACRCSGLVGLMVLMLFFRVRIFNLLPETLPLSDNVPPLLQQEGRQQNVNVHPPPPPKPCQAHQLTLPVANVNANIVHPRRDE